MEEKSYSLESVEVILDSGVTLRATVKSLDGIRHLIDDVHKAKLGTFVSRSEKAGHSKVEQASENLTNDPLDKMQARSGVSADKLKKVLGVKDGVPQLMNPNQFKTTDAVLTLLFSAETGLGKTNLDYETFSEFFDQQNIKSGSPLAMMCTNLRNAGYLDKKAYVDGRKVRLTAKGEKQAISALEKSVSAQR